MPVIGKTAVLQGEGGGRGTRHHLEVSNGGPSASRQQAKNAMMWNPDVHAGCPNKHRKLRKTEQACEDAP